MAEVQPTSRSDVRTGSPPVPPRLRPGVGAGDRNVQPSRSDEGDNVSERFGAPRSRLGRVHLDSIDGGEGDEREDALRASREFDRVRDLTAARSVENRVDPVGGDAAHAVDRALAIGDRLRIEGAEPVNVVFARRGDDTRTTGDGQLYGEGAHATGRCMEQQGLPREDLKPAGYLPGGNAPPAGVTATSHGTEAGSATGALWSASADSA